MASSLPDNPSLERLRSDARRLQRAVRAEDARAVELVRTHHPSPQTALADTGAFALSAAQVVVARGYGFAGWPDLVRYLDVARPLSRDPGAVDPGALSPADRFCALACLRYDGDDGPHRWAAAAEMLAAEPGLVEESVWAAAAATDADALAAHLRRDPGLAAREGGPFRWAPMLYLAFSRVPPGPTEQAVVAAVNALLDAGADPDSGYLWRGLSSPFTALTGAFGHGEQGPRRQPAHPHGVVLAELLLDAGADPNDAQALYNRMFVPDDTHLQVLLRHGFGRPSRGPWARWLGAATPSPDVLVAQQVRWAADHGYEARLSLLAQHGVDVSGAHVVRWAVPDDPDALVGGRTALHEAAWDGDLGRIRALLDAGADPTVRDSAHDATPLDWAVFALQDDAADLLRTFTRGAEGRGRG